MEAASTMLQSLDFIKCLRWFLGQLNMQCRSICLVAFVKSLISMLLTLFALPFAFFRCSFIFVELNILWTTLVKILCFLKLASCLLPTRILAMVHKIHLWDCFFLKLHWFLSQMIGRRIN